MASFSGRLVDGTYRAAGDIADVRAAYVRDGYVVLRGFLTEAEIDPIEVVYNKFMSREIPIPGKDFTDMCALVVLS